MVRVFTNAEERMADPELLKAFEAELSATSLSAQLELGGIKATEYEIEFLFLFQLAHCDCFPVYQDRRACLSLVLKKARRK